jgi:hypothetical protein
MKSIFFTILILFTPCEDYNYLISKTYIDNEISFEEFITKFDTTKIALQNFLDTSVEKNMIDTVLRVTSGPIEFEAIIDSLFKNFGKTGRTKILDIINAIEKFSDGYVAEFVSVMAASYCDKYPHRFKKIIVFQGERSWILYSYLFARGSNWKKGLMFLSKSEYNNKIIKWAEAIIELEK